MSVKTKGRLTEYSKTKDIKKRKKFDLLIIMIALVGIVGSALVFNSYASKKINTSTPGQYSLIRLISQTDSKYKDIAKTKTESGNDIYKLNQAAYITMPFVMPKSKFCILGWNRSGAFLSFSYGDNENEIKPAVDNLSTDYPLTNQVPAILQCYDSSIISGLKTNLVIKSNGNIWIDKIETE